MVLENGLFDINDMIIAYDYYFVVQHPPFSLYYLAASRWFASITFGSCSVACRQYKFDDNRVSGKGRYS
jgi:hypothetical protein